ncbi:MAG: Gfo/Idh/MocA family oxidoreductase [Armatimonadetes bacterium]|nr:Gfo/Idh/MocA family oxidoreductase [Armatimonadota bacterium]
MAKKGFAVIGAGLWGEMHAQAYSSHPEARLAAVCDLREERASQIASKYGAGRACTDWREIASDDTIDAVSIVTPDFAHREIAVALAQAGKHMLVEKPLATTVQECEAIIAAAKDAGVKLMVDFHNRWNPPFHQTHAMLRSGEAGAVRFVQVWLSNTTAVPFGMLSWAAQSSSLWFLGSHAIDLTCWLVGEWPTRVYAVAPRGVLKSRGLDIPDFFQSVLEFPGGAVGSVHNSWILPESNPTICELTCRVVAEKGAVGIDALSSKVFEMADAKGYRYGDVLGHLDIQGAVGGFTIESIKHFADCVIQDREPLVPGEAGLEVTRVACAVEQSAKTGEPVVIER